ncbi:MAG: hypothetical protein QM778_33180 [Myxococcales bacterium]
MAITTLSNADWMRQNPQLVQGVQQRYQQPEAPQVQAAPVQAPAPAQATDTERVPMYAQPASPVQVGTGAQAGTATEAKDHGADGVKRIASTIASFYTGGAASGITGMLGGKNQVDPTHDESANDKKQGGMDGGQVLGLLSQFMGKKGK